MATLRPFRRPRLLSRVLRLRMPGARSHASPGLMSAIPLTASTRPPPAMSRFRRRTCLHGPAHLVGLRSLLSRWHRPLRGTSFHSAGPPAPCPRRPGRTVTVPRLGRGGRRSHFRPLRRGSPAPAARASVLRRLPRRGPPAPAVPGGASWPPGPRRSESQLQLRGDDATHPDIIGVSQLGSSGLYPSKC